jgi:hypothetical protein
MKFIKEEKKGGGGRGSRETFFFETQKCFREMTPGGRGRPTGGREGSGQKRCKVRRGTRKMVQALRKVRKAMWKAVLSLT